MKLCRSAIVAALSLTCSDAAYAACELRQIAQFPVVMDGNDALVDATINGQPVKLKVDTGAYASAITPEAAVKLGLQPVDYGVRLYGVGGGGQAPIASVDLGIGGAIFKKQAMFVSGAGIKHQKYAGLLGQELLSKTDIELDLANGVVRMIKPKDCVGDQVAYWAKSYSIVSMAPSSNERDLRVYVQLNGRPVLAVVDTGAYTSFVTTGAAEQAGVTPHSEGSHSTSDSGGIGIYMVPTYTGIFKTLSVGDEKVANAKIRIADLFARSKEVNLGSRIPESAADFPSMLLGADFIHSHRMYLAYSQGRIYFTYNGGPIFQSVGESEADKPALGAKQ